MTPPKLSEPPRNLTHEAELTAMLTEPQNTAAGPPPRVRGYLASQRRRGPLRAGCWRRQRINNCSPMSLLSRHAEYTKYAVGRF
jgi:hypothetical protein